MSEQDDLIDRANQVMREHVIDCYYRIEKLEQTYLAREPCNRLPQLTHPQDVYNAMEDLKKRLEVVEAIVEQSE